MIEVRTRSWLVKSLSLHSPSLCFNTGKIEGTESRAVGTEAGTACLLVRCAFHFIGICVHADDGLRLSSTSASRRHEGRRSGRSCTLSARPLFLCPFQLNAIVPVSFPPRPPPPALPQLPALAFKFYDADVGLNPVS